MSQFATWLQRRWYSTSAPSLLTPLSALYRCITSARVSLFKFGIKRQYQADVPVIVVGNLSVGGTGKTPVVSWLIKQLQLQGYTPGVVSRGYGADLPQPVVVDATMTADAVGDEPRMLLDICGDIPLVVFPKRALAVQTLRQHYPDVDVIVCDDGLQHYALARDIELVVVDGERGLGNQWCLPAGPLREPLSRLQTVDGVIINGDDQRNTAELLPSHVPCATMSLQISEAVNLHTGARQPLTEFAAVTAYAGIGNPARFFSSLSALIPQVQGIAMPDHHDYALADFADCKGDVFMTQKDAVKCRALALDTLPAQCWYVPVDVAIDAKLMHLINQKLQ